VQLGVDALKVGEGDLLLEDHLVEADDEIRVEEATVEYAEPEATADKFEVVQVLRVHAGRRVDLQGIVVVRRVLEQTVERVEHLVRKKEEEFPASRRVRKLYAYGSNRANLDKPP
jgi:hypothetical protein